MPDLIPLPGSLSITPYASLQVQTLFIPFYAEQASSSAALFALGYDSNTTTSTRTELGARFGRTIELDQDAVLSLRSRLAWAHDEGNDATIDVGLTALPGVKFHIEGADADGDFLLASAGAEVRFSNGFSIGGFVDSQLSDRSQSFSGSGRLSYAW